MTNPLRACFPFFCAFSAFLWLVFLEAVADPGFGEDVAWRGCVGFDLFAQVADEDAQVLVLFDVVAAPQRREQRTMSKNLAGVFYEVDQQIEFFRRQMNWFASHRDLARLEIDVKVSRVENRWRCLIRRWSIRTTQRSPHARQQLIDPKRLGNKIVGAEIERFHLRLLFTLR